MNRNVFGLVDRAERSDTLRAIDDWTAVTIRPIVVVETPILGSAPAAGYEPAAVAAANEAPRPVRRETLRARYLRKRARAERATGPAKRAGKAQTFNGNAGIRKDGKPGTVRIVRTVPSVATATRTATRADKRTGTRKHSDKGFPGTGERAPGFGSPDRRCK